MQEAVERIMESAQKQLELQARLFAAVNPSTVLARGYAIVRSNGRAVTSVQKLASGQLLELQLLGRNRISNSKGGTIIWQHTESNQKSWSKYLCICKAAT